MTEITEIQAKISAEFPGLSTDVVAALAQYDADVADGTITFKSNGHRDTDTHPEVWVPASYVTMAGTTLPSNRVGRKNIWDY